MSASPSKQTEMSPMQAQKITNEVAERYKHSKLLNFPENLELHGYMQGLKKALCSDVIARPSNKMVPRFGSLSLMAAGTGFFVYDHPELVKRVPTAFACGSYVFFSAPFLREHKNEGHDSAAFVSLHELSHIGLLHALRMLMEDPVLRNWAMDAIINTRLRISFESGGEASEWRKKHSKTGDAPEPIATLRYGDVVRGGIGFESGDLEKFGRLSEEEAIRLFKKDILDQLRQQAEKGQGNPGDPSDGDGGGGGPEMDIEEIRKLDPDLAKKLEEQAAQGQGSPGSGGGKPGSGKPGKGGKPGQGGEPGEGGGEKSKGWKADNGVGQSDELMTEDVFRQILEEVGLKGVADKLDLADTPEASDKKSEERAIKAKSAAQESNRLHREAGVKLPGGHMDSFIEETIGDLMRPKMTFRVGFRHMMAGEGNRADYQDEVAAPIFYIDPEDMNMSDAIFLGSEIPARRSGDILAIIDSSASMGPDELKEALSELIAIAKTERDDVRIILMWADTAIRKVEILREADLEGHVSFGAAGRGGTSMVNCTVQAMNHPIVRQSMQRGRLAGLVYLGDLGDVPPPRNQLPAKLPPFAYVATANAVGVNEFRRAVCDYAQVLQIEQGGVVDLEKKRPGLSMGR
jgi:hypothetical protein